jgi:hypothetical protein
MGMVSLGPEFLRRFRVVFLGGVPSLPCCNALSGKLNELRAGETDSPCGSELTTTIGGAGDALSPEYLRSGVVDGVFGEDVR